MFSLALTCLLSLSAGSGNDNQTIVRDSQTHWVIALLPGATEPVRHGALELQKHLELISGARLPIEDSASNPYLGITLRADRTLGPEAFRIRTVPSGIEISGDDRRGLLYGCYGLLEDVFGRRWYTAKISKIPRQPTLKVAEFDITQKPAFEYREPFYWEAFDRDWAVRNRVNGNAQRLDDSVGGKVMYGPFVHTFDALVPTDQYYDTHPEYFSMLSGKRVKGYYQLCLTNPDVLKISIAKVREWIRENPKATIFSVSQNDTDGHCQCDACKAVEVEEGAPSGVVLRFVNAVADAIAKDHPSVLIDTLAYLWTEKPPRLVRPRPNVRIRLAPIGACVAHPLDGCEANKVPLGNLLEWAKITNQLYIDPPTSPHLTNELLVEGTRLFDQAEAAAKADPVALEQVQRARLALEYVQLARSTADKPAPGGLKHDALVNTVAAKIARFEISSVREGEPVAQFLRRIGGAR